MTEETIAGEITAEEAVEILTDQQEAIEEEVTTESVNEQPTVTSPLQIGSMQVITPRIEDYKLKLLIYGDPGVGKTTLAATANACEWTSPALHVAIDPGTLSLAGFPWAPSIVELKNYRQLGEIFVFLRSNKNPFKTVIIDSLSELQLINLDAIVQARTKGKGGSEIYLEDYGDSTRQMRAAVRAFRDLPMHVIFTSAAASSMDAAKEETVFPALTPKLRGPVLGYMDVIAYMQTSTTSAKPGERPKLVRRILVQPYGKYQAKDRTPGGRLGIFVDNPTIGKMMELIYRKA